MSDRAWGTEGNYRDRIEFLYWARTGKTNGRGALSYYARLAGLPVDYVETRARGDVMPDDEDFRRIYEVWHDRPAPRHRWKVMMGNRDGIVWRCSRCRATLRGQRRTASLMLSRCTEGQMTAHEKKRFA